MPGNTVTLKFLGDTRDIEKSFRVVQGETEQTQSKFGQFSSALKPMAVAAGATIAAAFGRASVDAYRESEDAQNRLRQSFAKFPKMADISISSLRSLNTELQKKTKFDDDATASGQAVLAQFGLTGKQVAALTPLLQDYAAKTGKDLPSAATDLGKAVLGQGRALKTVGLNLKDTGSAAGNLDQLMGGLRKQVGGFAQAEGKTASGQAAILTNQFGELQEKVGSALVPALSKLADILLSVVGFFQSLPGPAQAAIGVVAGLVVVAIAVTKAIQAWAAVQAVLNVVMTANPIGLIIVAIAALVAGLIIAYKNSETFRNIVQAAWDVLKGVASFIGTVVVGAFRAMSSAVGAVFGFIQRNWPMLLAILTGPIGLAVKFIVDNFNGIVSFISGLPGRIASAASGMWDGIKNAFKSAINWIIRAWNGLDFSIPSVEVFGKKVGGQSIGTPNIPLLASGGIVKRPTLAMIGEAGPEAVIPLGRGGYGSPSTITINMPPGSDGEDVVAAIRRWERRNGPGWRS